MELKNNNVNAESVISELLQQNADLRLELAILRALADEQNHVDALMRGSNDLSSLPPEAIEMLSKLDIR